MDVKPSIFRRFLAWIPDTLLALALLGGVFWYTATPETLVQQGLLQEITDNSTLIKEKAENLRVLVDDLQAQLTPEEAQAVNLKFQQLLRERIEVLGKATLEGQPWPEDPVRILSDEVMAGLLQADWKFTNPKSLESLGKTAAQAQALVSQANFWELLADLLPDLLKLFLWPLVAYLLWFIPEIFFGASPAQLVFGLKTGTRDGYKTNVLVYLVRFLLKHAGILFILAGLYWSQPLLAASGAAYLLITAFSLFNVLGTRRQALYESLTGTALWKKKDLRLPE